MSQFETFDIIEQVITINDIKVPVTVIISVGDDDILIEDDYDNGTPEEIQAYRERFYRGELFMGLIKVEARALEMIGTDYLGACHLHSKNMLNSEPFDRDVREAVESHGMMQTALDELTELIRSQANKLKPFANGEVES